MISVIPFFVKGFDECAFLVDRNENPSTLMKMGKKNTELSIKSLSRFMDSVNKSGCVVFDYETTDLDTNQAQIDGLAMYSPGIRGAEELSIWIPLVDGTMSPSKKWPVSTLDDLINAAKPIFENRKNRIMAHNYMYDGCVTMRHITEDISARAIDTMYAARLVKPWLMSLNLSALAKTYAKIKIPKYSDLEEPSQPSLFGSRRKKYLGSYSMRQVRGTWKLWRVFYEEMDDLAKERFFNLDMPLLQYSCRLKHFGIPYDLNTLDSLFNSANDNLANYQKALIDRFDFDYDPRRVGALRDFLYNDIGLPMVPGKPLGQQPVKRSIISQYACKFPVIDSILGIQDAVKIRDTISNAYDCISQYSRLHPRYEGHKHLQDRFICNDPLPLSSLPRSVRSFIVPEDNDYLVGLDYQCFGLNVLACLSQDQNLLRDCQEDAHQVVADKLNITRDEAKVINSSIYLGKSAESLAQEMGVVSDDGEFDDSWVSSLMRDWHAKYPNVGVWLNRQFDRFCEGKYRLYNGLGGFLDMRKKMNSHRDPEKRQ